MPVPERRPRPRTRTSSPSTHSTQIVDDILQQLIDAASPAGYAADPADLLPDVLYYGNNLGILRDHIPSSSVDVVYLDPPFNSNRKYNVIFKDESGIDSDGQILAFEDTWHWGPRAETTYAYLTNTRMNKTRVPESVSEMSFALRKVVGDNQMMAYLVEMLVRLVELHRVLKPSGSLFLHCDPTASHYLKLALDAVFSPQRFINEIVWKRTSAHSDTSQGAVHLGRIHDTILYYTKGANPTRQILHLPYTNNYTRTHYRGVEPGTGRRYEMADLTVAKPGGDTSYEWHTPDGTVVRPYAGRYWAYSKERMTELERQGRLVYSKSGMPRYKRYLDEVPGVPVQDVWDDIPPINSQAKERLGWATQKPLALLERIISLASKPGDVVLDPFCGCGSALIAAQTLGRRWIGIDITYLAIAVMRSRLRDECGLPEVTVVNEPTELDGVRQLLEQPDGRYQFQWWALSKIGAMPAGSVRKKGADRGIDGKITFTERDELQGIIVSVKSGQVQRGMVGELLGTMQRERAAMGLFVTLVEPTRDMKREAEAAGRYYSEVSDRYFPRIQILTVRNLLDGLKPSFPLLIHAPYRNAGRRPSAGGQQGRLFGETI